MADRLPGLHSVVHTDIERRRMELLSQQVTPPGDLPPQFAVLRLRQVEERGHVLLGDHERVPRRDGKPIEERNDGVRGCQNSLWRQSLAEWTLGRAHVAEDASSVISVYKQRSAAELVRFAHFDRLVLPWFGFRATSMALFIQGSSWATSSSTSAGTS